MTHTPQTIYAIQRAQSAAMLPPWRLRNLADLCGDCGRKLAPRKRLGLIAGRIVCMSCALTREVKP